MEQKPFSDILSEMRGGEVERLLTAAMADVCSAVATIGGRGVVTLSLKIKSNGEGSVVIEPDVNHRAPKPSIGRAIFFVDAVGSLHRSDPRQTEIALPEGVTFIGKDKERKHG